MNLSTPTNKRFSVVPATLLVLALAAAVAVVILGRGTSADAAVVSVGAGQSIQAAIDAAQPGDTIEVAPGTYHENLTIRTNDLTLSGAGAGQTVLMPPAERTPSICTEGKRFNGICITGEFVRHSLTVGEPVVNTTVTGFSVRGFSRYGILVNNAVNAQIRENEISDSGRFGVMGLFERHVAYADNVLSDNAGGGLQLADSLGADATITGNRIVGSHGPGGMGIFIRDAEAGTVSGNVSQHNCAGIVVVDSVGTAPASGWNLTDNTVKANNGACRAPEEGGPPISGVGVALLGVSDTTATGNVVRGNRPAEESPLASGILLASSKTLGGSDPRGTTVSDNRASGNRPADLLYDGSGSGNKFSDNHCAMASPAQLCR